LRSEYAQRRLGFALQQLKFVDETGINLAMTRRYGRAAPGVRVVESVPHNYGENVSLLAAMGVTGVSAPMTVEGAVDTEVFRTWTERVLGPTLEPGDIVVLDNLSVHQVAGIAESIARAEGHGWSRCPRIRPSSIRSSSAGPSSKLPCARPARAPATRLTRRSSTPSRPSLPPMRRPGSLIVAILYIHR
jgi:hypothetical protein